MTICITSGIAGLLLGTILGVLAGLAFGRHDDAGCCPGGRGYGE